MKDSYLARPSNLDTHHKPSPDRYEKMLYRTLGKSGLKLPLLTLGMWQNFGDTEPYSNSREMILGAFDLGMTHFDLGNNYGKPAGSAERTLGRVLREDLRGYRDEIIVSTKAGYDMWQGPYGENGSKKHIIASLDQSLERLGLDYVDIFYSHKFDANTPLEETMEAFAQIVKQGKALYLGVSSYGPEETARAHKILQSMGVRSLLLHQPSYSMLNRWIEKDLLDTLETLGMGAVVFTPLAQGLLSDKYTTGKIPSVSRASAQDTLLPPKLVNENVVKKLKALSIIAKKRGQTLSQMALAWTLRDKRVASTVVGARNLSQIKENVQALKNLKFSASELKEIDKYATDVVGINLWPPNCQTSEV